MGFESPPLQVIDLYGRLRNSQGLQGWWPGESSFEVAVGCILTQNTSWRNVEKAIASLQSNNLLSPDAILAIPVEELAGLIKPSGFPTQKPARLKSISRWWRSKFGESIFPLQHVEEHSFGDSGQLRIPTDFAVGCDGENIRDELLALNGVGAETADAILLYALGKPFFVIDAYTRRICCRLGLIHENTNYTDFQKFFQSSLPHDVKLYNDFHAQFVALAKDHCRKTPVCRGCPIRDICHFNS